MSTQLVIVDPKEFNLDNAKAETIASAFTPKLVEREAYAQQYAELITQELSPELSKKASELRKKLVKVRTGIAEIHKTEKAFYLAGGRFVDALKNKYILSVEQMEEKLEEIENYYINIEKQRIEALRLERLAQLLPLGYVEDSRINLGDIDETIYNSIKLGLETKRAEEEKAAKEAEELRLAELAKDKAENERRLLIAPYAQFDTSNSDLRNMTDEVFTALLTSLQTAKKEYEAEQAKIREENERLRKEAESAELQAKQEREASEKKLAEERAKAEAERKAIEEKARKEAQEAAEKQAKLEAELQAKKDAEAKAEADKQAALEAELSKGDSAKIEDLKADIEALKTKYTFKSAKNQKTQQQVNDLFDKVITFINSKK